VVVARFQGLLLLGTLLDFGGDTAVLGRTELVEDGAEFVVLLDVFDQHQLVDVLGASPQSVLLQRSERDHSIAPVFLADAELAGEVERTGGEHRRPIVEHGILNEAAFEHEEGKVLLGLA
jgi:hypothetical protein